MRCLIVLLSILLVVGSSSADSSASYFKFHVDEDALSGAADFSFLNQSLKPKDKIFACGEHFCRVGKDLKPNSADDEPIRLFGVNLGAQASLPNSGDAVRIAKRLRKLGVNLVRLHYLDGPLNTKGASAEPIGLLSDEKFPTLDERAIDRLRFFINRLSEEGIYIDLNLHVSYTFRPQVDAVTDGAIPFQSKPLFHFDLLMRDRQKEYVRRLFRQLDIAGKSVLAMVEISNESSLPYTWQLAAEERRSPLSGEIRGAYANDLLRIWREYSGLTQMPLRLNGNTESVQLMRFFVNIERSYFNSIADVIRAETDSMVPISGTQNFYGGLPIAIAQSDLSYYDNHIYPDYYRFSGNSGDEMGWLISGASFFGGGGNSLIAAAYLRVAGKPYSISEFSVPFPNVHGADSILAFSLFANFQDWSAINLYEYSKFRDWDDPDLYWFNLKGDASRLAILGQAAWLFRTQNFVANCEQRIGLSNEKVMEMAANGVRSWDTGKAISDGISLPLAIAKDSIVKIDIAASEKEDPGRDVSVRTICKRSQGSSKDLQFSEDGYTLDSKDAVAYRGNLGPHAELKLGPFLISNPDPFSQAITFAATKNRSDENSNMWLITILGGGYASQPGDPDRPIFPMKSRSRRGLTFSKTVGSSAGEIIGKAPVWLEGKRIELRLSDSTAPYYVMALDSSGQGIQNSSFMMVNRSSGGVVLDSSRDGTPWYKLSVEKSNR